MKNFILKTAFFIFAILSLTSCVSTNRGFQSSPVISRNINLDPIKADINVDASKKLKGESTSSYFLIFRTSGDNTFADGITYSTDASSSPLSKLNVLKSARLNKVRGAAAAKALQNSNADVLVHPTYKTKVTNFLYLFKTYEVTVEGYGATYSNFRTEKQKIVILQDGKEVILQDNK